MHFKFRHLQKIVGGFFLLAILMVVVLLVIVARGQRWFQSYTPYVAYFETSGGLRNGSMVLIRDLEAGRIESVRLDEDNRVKVIFKVFSQYADRLREGSVAKVSKPVVGSTSLALVLGPADAPQIDKGGIVSSEKDVGAGLDGLIENTTKLIRELEDPEGDLMQTLANVNVATKSLSDAMTKGDSSLRMLLEKRDLYDELTSATSHLDNLMGTLDESSPDIEDAILEARRGLEEVNKVVRALQKSIFIRGNIESYLSEDSTLKYEARAE